MFSTGSILVGAFNCKSNSFMISFIQMSFPHRFKRKELQNKSSRFMNIDTNSASGAQIWMDVKQGTSCWYTKEGLPLKVILVYHCM